MLNKIEVRNSQGSLLTFEFDDISDGLVLEDVQGLDPVKAVPVSSKFAKLKGKQLHAIQIEERNIKITLGLEPDYVTTSVQDLRDRLYAYFMSGEHVSIRLFRSEGLVVDIEGEVETCESPLFTDKPKMEISILCLEPDFVNVLTPVTLSGTTVSDGTETSVTYAGNTSSGMVITLNVDRSLTQFTIYFRPPDGTLRTFDFSATLAAGDTVIISTVPGSKFVTRTRAGTVTSLLYGVSSQSNWHQWIKQGIHHIRVYAVGAAIPYTIDYLDRYGAL